MNPNEGCKSIEDTPCDRIIEQGEWLEILRVIGRSITFCSRGSCYDILRPLAIKGFGCP